MFALFFLLTFTSGCAKKTTVVLLPDDDGTVGQVIVSTSSSSIELQKAGEATVISSPDSAPSVPEILEKETIDSTFGEALSALPDKPVHFLLYFFSDSTQLTMESTEIIPQILKAIRKRSSIDISVIGHSDTAGDPSYNLTLSKKRASAVARIISMQGIDKTYIHVTSHGEGNPLIKTADNVHEPRNRRVEVVVR